MRPQASTGRHAELARLRERLARALRDGVASPLRQAIVDCLGEIDRLLDDEARSSLEAARLVVRAQSILAVATGGAE